MNKLLHAKLPNDFQLKHWCLQNLEFITMLWQNSVRSRQNKKLSNTKLLNNLETKSVEDKLRQEVDTQSMQILQLTQQLCDLTDIQTLAHKLITKIDDCIEMFTGMYVICIILFFYLLCFC